MPQHETILNQPESILLKSRNYESCFLTNFDPVTLTHVYHFVAVSVCICSDAKANHESRKAIFWMAAAASGSMRSVSTCLHSFDLLWSLLAFATARKLPAIFDIFVVSEKNVFFSSLAVLGGFSS